MKNIAIQNIKTFRKIVLIIISLLLFNSNASSQQVCFPCPNSNFQVRNTRHTDDTSCRYNVVVLGGVLPYTIKVGSQTFTVNTTPSSFGTVCSQVSIIKDATGCTATITNGNLTCEKIHTSSVTSPICPGDGISVSFTVTGIFNQGNVFIAQLSNASGSFVSPVPIGSLPGTSPGIITATIPSGTPIGGGYRIRVISTNPAVIGTDNGASIAIAPHLKTESVGGNEFYPGQAHIIQYSNPCFFTFNPSNIFTAQLSDADGRFDNPVVLGSVPGTSTAPNIDGLIPGITPQGRKYRIRVMSSDPPSISIPNSTDLLISHIATHEIPGSPFCTPQNVTINFSVGNPTAFNAGNIFKAQLSDALGNFNASSIILGQTLMGTFGGLGSIDGEIPEGTVNGTGYRIRVISTNPSYEGLDNGTDLTVGNINSPDADGDGFTVCQNDCDDTKPFVHPNAEEICGNNIDENCDGLLIKNQCQSSFAAAITSVNNQLGIGCPGIAVEAQFVFDNCYDTWSVYCPNLALMGLNPFVGTANKGEIMHALLPVLPNAHFTLQAIANGDEDFQECGKQTFNVVGNNGNSSCDGVVSIISSTPASSLTARDGKATLHLTTNACLSSSWNLTLRNLVTNEEFTGEAGGNNSNIEFNTLPQGRYNISISYIYRACSNLNAGTLIIPCVSPETGPISGQFEGVCKNTTKTYSVAPQPETIFQWVVPSNATILSGQTTNSITIRFSPQFNSTLIRVTAANTCGIGPVTQMTINSTPSIPSTIQGPVSVCKGSFYSYSCTPVPGATSYEWKAPGGSQITGNGTNTVCIKFGNNSGGDVKVRTINACGNSEYQIMAVTSTNCTGPNSCSPTPFADKKPTEEIKTDIKNSNEFNVHVIPNPSDNYFKIMVNSKSNEMIEIRIMDITGRVVANMRRKSGETIRFGDNLKAGVYFAEIIQGTSSKIIKLIKQ